MQGRIGNVAHERPGRGRKLGFWSNEPDLAPSPPPPPPRLHVEVSGFQLNSKSAWARSRPSCRARVHASPQGRNKGLGLPLGSQCPGSGGRVSCPLP